MLEFSRAYQENSFDCYTKNLSEKQRKQLTKTKLQALIVLNTPDIKKLDTPIARELKAYILKRLFDDGSGFFALFRRSLTYLRASKITAAAAVLEKIAEQNLQDGDVLPDNEVSRLQKQYPILNESKELKKLLAPIFNPTQKTEKTQKKQNGSYRRLSN